MDPRREYLKVRVETASREDLLLMLFDGLLRFLGGARDAIRRRDRERKHALLIRAQAIVVELLGALDTSIGEPAYGRLSGLYRFAHRRLVDANVGNDARALEEARRILDHLRETWRLAVQKNREERAEESSAPAGELSVEG